MTINHVFVHVSAAQFAAMRAFYGTVLRPLGYTEMMHPRDDLLAFGSDYPYLWLKRVDAETMAGAKLLPTHIALDAPDQAAVRTFFELGL